MGNRTKGLFILFVVVFFISCIESRENKDLCAKAAECGQGFLNDYGRQGNILCKSGNMLELRIEITESPFPEAHTNLECAKIVMSDILSKNIGTGVDSIQVWVGAAGHPQYDAFFGCAGQYKYRFLNEEQELSAPYLATRKYLIKERPPMDFVAYNAIYNSLHMLDPRLKSNPNQDFWTGLRSYSRWKNSEDADLDLVKFMVFLNYLKVDTTSVSEGDVVSRIFSAGKLKPEEL